MTSMGQEIPYGRSLRVSGSCLRVKECWSSQFIDSSLFPTLPMMHFGKSPKERDREYKQPNFSSEGGWAAPGQGEELSPTGGARSRTLHSHSLPESLPEKSYWACPTGWRPWGCPGRRWNALESHWTSWWRYVEPGKYWCLCRRRL